jgi:nucleoside-diphosphate-sugar epimerase
VNYHLSHGVEVRIIRIFNTYGPRLDPNDGRVVSSFLRDGILGKPLQVFGSLCFLFFRVSLSKRFLLIRAHRLSMRSCERSKNFLGTNVFKRIFNHF